MISAPRCRLWEPKSFVPLTTNTVSGGVYRNEPRFQVRDKSEIHYSAVWLRVITKPLNKLMGP
jgi:hypothetical protein